MGGWCRWVKPLSPPHTGAYTRVPSVFCGPCADRDTERAPRAASRQGTNARHLNIPQPKTLRRRELETFLDRSHTLRASLTCIQSP